MIRQFRQWPYWCLTGSLLVIGACSGAASAEKRGDSYFAAKDYAKAAIEYRTGAERDPKSAVLRQKLARSYVELGILDGARREFVRAADLLPNDDDAQLDAATALFRSGEFLDARTRAQNVLKRNPHNVKALLLQGVATAGLRDLDTALKDLQQAIELDPSLPQAHADLGALQLAKGQATEAEASLQQAAQLAPQDPGPQLAIAQLRWGQKDKDGTERALNEALKRAPADPLANRALAMFFLTTGRSAEAERPLKAAARPDAPEAQLTLADYYLGQKRPDDAKAVLETLSKRPEAHAAAEARLAGIDYEQNRRELAYQRMDALIKAQPSNVQVLLVKTRWLLSEGRKQEARDSARAAVAADPRSAEAQFQLGVVYRALQDTTAAMKAFSDVLSLNSRAVGAQIQLAQLNLAVGKPDVAVRFANDAVALSPQNPEARLTLVHALKAHGDLDRAQAELEPIMKAASTSAQVNVEAGEIAMRRHDHRAARAAFERALKLDPRSTPALTGLVTADIVDKRPQDAQARLDAALAARPKDAPLLMLAGRAAFAGRDMPRAEALFKRAVEADPSYFPAYNGLGQVYVAQNRLDEALRRYEQLATQQPDSVAAHTMVAMILQVQNHPAEARAQYEKILQIDSRAAVAANNLAFMNAEAGTELDTALQLAQTAKSVQPDDPDVDDTLGWVYVKKNLAQLAIEPLRRSVAHTPGNAQYRYHLGVAYAQVGNKALARETLTEALRLQPNFENAGDARRALDALGR
jgi:tetratricopeptide (TPR) repeat protein